MKEVRDTMPEHTTDDPRPEYDYPSVDEYGVPAPPDERFLNCKDLARKAAEHGEYPEVDFNGKWVADAIIAMEADGMLRVDTHGDGVKPTLFLWTPNLSDAAVTLKEATGNPEALRLTVVESVEADVDPQTQNIGAFPSTAARYADPDDWCIVRATFTRPW
ncbi:MAG: hypothetical protein ACI9CA_000004 [Natronomonas sp.]